MKRRDYTDIICKKFCTFYKDGKEELTCGTYRFLAERYTPEELDHLISDLNMIPDYSCDDEVMKFICAACDFVVDGCDFREKGDAPPCGGYTIVEAMITRHKLSW
jgi:hypothetical protein